VGTPFEARQGGSLRDFVRFVLGYEARQLFPEQRRDRSLAARRQHPRLVNEIVVER
jgi:hypothetical protein